MNIKEIKSYLIELNQDDLMSLVNSLDELLSEADESRVDPANVTFLLSLLQRLVDFT